MEIELIGSEEFEEVKKDKNIYLVDVRKNKEYNEEHIKGAVNIPLEDIEDIENGNILLLRRLWRVLKSGKRIILYCKTGTRSMRGAKILGEYGIKSASVFGISIFGID